MVLIDNYEKIKPYSVEFGQYNGFSNVLVHPFHMPEPDFDKARTVIEGSTKHLLWCRWKTIS